jgi:hypothetical protein
MAARRRSPGSVSGATALSERRTVTALAAMLLGGYDVAHLGAPILLSYVPIWFVASGNCWFVASGNCWFVVSGNCWFVASGNCWLVASGNWWQLCQIFRMEFPVGVLNTPNFYFQVYSTITYLFLVNVCYTNNYTNTNSNTNS